MGVSVSDAHGEPVAGLQKENFRTFDDGVERPITYFASVEASAQVLVIVETGPAVYLIHKQHLAAAGALADGLAAEDEVALVAYDQAPRVLLPMTADRAALVRAMQGLEYSLGSGELNLFDAISTAVDWLAPAPGKKVIVLLSTGLDTSRAGQWEALVEKLRGSEVSIFPVALGGELRSTKQKKKSKTTENHSSLSFEQADRALNSLAQITGGRAFFPRSAADFAPIYRLVAATLRHQYILGIEPAARDGRFHTITVQVLDANGNILAPTAAKSSYHISAREGYRAPAQ